MEPTTGAIIHSDLKNWFIISSLHPKFISGIHMVMIAFDIALIVMKNKKVYSLCEVCKGSLGMDKCDNTLHPREVKVLSEKVIKKFACRDQSYFLALTEDGEVYSFGHNCDLENDENNQDIPTLVNMSNSSMERVVDIACGSYHSFAVTEEGKAFSWRKDNRSQQIYLNKKIVQVASGDNFSVIVTKDGKVYSIGANEVGQLGQNKASMSGHLNQISLPRTVKVACGVNHTLALTDDGKVYAWGGNEWGQLGMDNRYGQLNSTQDITKEKFYIPHMVCFNRDLEIIDIATLHSSYMSVAVSKNEGIYLWGKCLLGNILTPTLTGFSTVHEVFKSLDWSFSMHEPMLILQIDEELNILKCLENALDDESTSDLTIQVEDQPIHVHKTILKIRCPYFKNMFQHNWVENNQNVIKYSEYSYTVFKAFLKYLYTGMVDLPVEDAFELMKLADEYCEDNLKRYCIQLIKKKTNITNVIFLYCTTIKYNVKILEDFCLKFIVDHLTELVQTEAFRELNDINVLKTVICQFVKTV